MSKAERGLIAYTVLQSCLQQQGDLYDGLMLFIGPAIPPGGGLFVPAHLSRRIADLYCMRVPPLVLESLAEKMCKAGFLTKRAEANGIVSYGYGATAIPPSSVTLPRIRALLDDFIAFARDRHEPLRSETDDDLENALLDRLLHIESLAILSRRDGIELPKQTASTLGLPRRTNERPDDRLGQHLDYLTSRFLVERLETDREGFDVLADVAAANLAAETLLSYREPPSKGDTFGELEVFLDAPLCMDMLGVNPGREEYGKQLAEELRRADVKINVFLHSVAEIERVLDARRQSYLNGRGPYEHFQVDPPLTRELVAVTLGHVEEILTDQFRVSIVDSASSIPAGRRAAVGAAEEHSIRERLSGWRNEDAREADVSTCCDLIRLRSPLTVQRRILKSGVVLVTRNDTLAKAANGTWRNWLTETKRASVDRARDAAPIAVSDKHLLGIIWITQGGQIGEISRAHLIANCAAAITTKRDVITRVYNTLIRVSEHSAQIFAAVINDQRAERAVMDATVGDPALVTDETGRRQLS